MLTAPENSTGRSAQSLIEYALILVLVAIVVVTALMALGRRPEDETSGSQQTQEKELAP